MMAKTTVLMRTSFHFIYLFISVPSSPRALYQGTKQYSKAIIDCITRGCYLRYDNFSEECCSADIFLDDDHLCYIGTF